MSAVLKTPQQIKAEKEAVNKIDILSNIRKSARLLADHRILRPEQIEHCVALYIVKNPEIIGLVYGPDLDSYLKYKNAKDEANRLADDARG